jgi:uncharacterized protein
MDTFTEFADRSRSEGSVRGFLHRPADPTGDGLILTHGAGADCRSLLLIALAEAFSTAGLLVLRCDLPFRQTQPHGPPRRTAERDQAGLHAAVLAMRPQVAGKVFLGGHSYGGRQASMLAAGETGLVARLLLLSYPLHPPARPGELRTQHFPSLETPALFVLGTRDGFASLEEMNAARELIPAPTRVISIDGAGHELMKKGNRDRVAEQVVTGFLSFPD